MDERNETRRVGDGLGTDNCSKGSPFMFNEGQHRGRTREIKNVRRKSHCLGVSHI